MAGSIVLTTSDLGGGITKYSLAWTSDGSGNVNSNPIALKRGHLMQIKFVPTNGGAQPSSGYNATLPDADGFDFFTGAGSNLSNSAAKLSVPVIGGVSPAFFPFLIEAQTAINLNITGAGAATNGRIDIYVGP